MAAIPTTTNTRRGVGCLEETDYRALKLIDATEKTILYNRVMNEHNQLLYLKNLFAVAHADGIVTPAEESFIESCRTRIGAKKSTFNKARKEAGDHKLNIQSIGRYSNRVQNLEDLIELAMCDDDLHENEKKQIASCANKAGISQEVINLILQEAKARRTQATPSCGSCGASLSPSSKFCPECGTPLSKPDVNKVGTRVELIIPESGITIAFAESTGASFPAALDAAKSHSTYQEAVRGRKKWYAATIAPSDSASILEIVNSLSGLRNKEVFLNGEPADWNKVFGYARCASERENAFDGIKYCFGVEDNRLNLWGCKALGMDWAEWAQWFTYGKFKRGDVFVFDMKRIVHELEQKLENVRLCPHLRINFISEILKAFPREVLVARNTGWEYQSGSSTHPNAIEATVHEDGFRYTTHVIGVRPLGTKAAKPVLASAVKRTKSKEIKLPQLGVR